MIPGITASRGRRNGSSIWTPAQLSRQPQFWLDWESQVELTANRVSTWENKGSLGGVFTAAYESRRPSIAVGPNGLRSIKFNGSSNALEDASSGARSAFSNVGKAWGVFLGRKSTSDAKVSPIFRSLTGGDGGRFAVYFGSNVAGNITSPGLLMRRMDYDPAGVIRSSLSPVLLGWTIVRVIADWDSRSGFIYTNGGEPEKNLSLTPTAGKTSSSTSNQPISIGAEAPFDSNFGDIECVNVIVGNDSAMPTEVEFLRLEGWLAHSAGMQAVLPSSHPYRLVPPTK